MANASLLRNACIIFAVCMATVIASPAQTFTTIYKFCSLANCADGYVLDAGLIQGTDGNFYGTTVHGGTNHGGTVFAITPEGTLTTLYNFCSLTNCSDGSGAVAALIQGTDGNFYGTTSAEGDSSNCYSGCGTVFKLTPTGTLTTLHSFEGTDGANPSAALIQGTDGNFYGTTTRGGTNNSGTVFEITPGGTLTTLHTFEGTDGQYPYAGLMQARDGNFYGTTQFGGAYHKGTIFEITAGGALTTLHSFGGNDGTYPYAGLVQAKDGNFYGTAPGGGAYGSGTIFEIAAGGTLATLHSFCAETNCSDGGTTYAGLIQATDGNFYGTTAFGGLANTSFGTIFRLAVAPAVTLLPTSLNFYSEALNEISAVKMVALRNSGTALLNIKGIAIDGNFAISGKTCGAVLAPGKTCKVSVTFTPSVLGKLTGTLTFTDNASNNPQIVSLSGTGVLPATLTPSSTAYGSQTVGGTSVAKTFMLGNNQNVPLSSIAISTTGDFAVSATTCTTSLSAKGKCTISVTFTPTATGTRTGKLKVSDSANNSPQTSTLTGTGK